MGWHGQGLPQPLKITAKPTQPLKGFDSPKPSLDIRFKGYRIVFRFCFLFFLIDQENPEDGFFLPPKYSKMYETSWKNNKSLLYSWCLV